MVIKCSGGNAKGMVSGAVVVYHRVGGEKRTEGDVVHNTCTRLSDVQATSAPSRGLGLGSCP